MKKHIQILTLTLSLTFWVGCDSILEIEPDGVISTEVLEDAEGLNKALIGAYYSLGGIADGVDGGELLGGDFIIIPTLLANVSGTQIIWDRVNGFDYNNFIDKEVLLTNPRVLVNWRRAYEVMNQVNTILANIDNIESDSERSRIQGEALAIRGVLYFEMIRLWGPQFGTGSDGSPTIPIRIEPLLEVGDIDTPPLSTLSEVYDRAETDLTEAATLLESAGSNGFGFNTSACQAYLARLHLQKMEYSEAEEAANEVIKSGGFTLESGFNSVFNNTANSTEDVFAIQQTEANNAGDRSFGTGLAFYYSSLTESGLGAMRIPEFFIFFDPEGPLFPLADDRGTVDIDVDENTTSDQINTAFHINVLNNVFLSPAKYLTSTNVIPSVRLAEVLLIRAEAIYEQNSGSIDSDALADLNAVRERAGLTTLVTADFGSPAEFRDAIRLERRRELLFEGQHLHDLKRWDGTVGSLNARDDRFILPIPQAETDTGTGG